MRTDQPKENPLFSSRGSFALPSSDLDDLLDFIEDMILMTGCPQCNSLGTRIIETDVGRILICLDCGHQELLPPPN